MSTCKGTSCPFYGRPETEGYCSVCYKTIVLKQAPPTPAPKPVQSASARREKPAVIAAVEKNDLNTLKQLIEAGGNVNEEYYFAGDEDLGPNTPLNSACFRGFNDIVLYLLEQPSLDVNKMAYGHTYAINTCCQNHHFNTAKLLVEECKKRKISLNLSNKGYGRWTPVETCCNEGLACPSDATKFKQLIKYLVEQGASASSNDTKMQLFILQALNE